MNPKLKAAIDALAIVNAYAQTAVEAEGPTPHIVAAMPRLLRKAGDAMSVINGPLAVATAAYLTRSGLICENVPVDGPDCAGSRAGISAWAVAAAGLALQAWINEFPGDPSLQEGIDPLDDAIAWSLDWCSESVN